METNFFKNKINGHETNVHKLEMGDIIFYDGSKIGVVLETTHGFENMIDGINTIEFHPTDYMTYVHDLNSIIFIGKSKTFKKYNINILKYLEDKVSDNINQKIFSEIKSKLYNILK